MFVLDWLKQLLQAHVLIPYPNLHHCLEIWWWDGNSISQNQTVTIPVSLQRLLLCNRFIQQNAALIKIAITGQSIKWYDALTNGNISKYYVAERNTYYASQNNQRLRSDNSILINIQNTAAPMRHKSDFCSSQNPTLNTIVISGTAYNGMILQGFYLTQLWKMALLITLQQKTAVSTKLAAISYQYFTRKWLCRNVLWWFEWWFWKVNLSDYNSKLISNTLDIQFSYYSSYSAAENQSVQTNY
jgi:hypothetical protein